ncbi:MAG: hypothetical protein A2Z07_06925 [Armatimonadetes bacterium RBG_16_67_12]|nr:MAG: hypothetical protein A2Z07_06925 [Armatimonadetes bacterium RBG_16_67_12]
MEVISMIRLNAGHPDAASGGRVLPRAAVLSFTLGMIALRVCWLPGVNCALAVASVGLGIVALFQILHAHGTVAGIEEAITGVVLGIVVLGLSVFFVSALIAAYH